MEAFGYLSVLISIILGLAIAEVLQGYRALLLARGRIHADPASLVWSALVLLFAAQAWWASFGLNRREAWDFLDFAVLLLQMGLLYMLSTLVLPDVPPEGHVDLAGHFERHRKAFFLFLIGVLASSILKEVVLEHRLPSPLNLTFHLVLGAVAGVGMAVGGRRAQLALALVALTASLSYVALLFMHL